MQLCWLFEFLSWKYSNLENYLWQGLQLLFLRLYCHLVARTFPVLGECVAKPGELGEEVTNLTFMIAPHFFPVIGGQQRAKWVHTEGGGVLYVLARSGQCGVRNKRPWNLRWPKDLIVQGGCSNVSFDFFFFAFFSGISVALSNDLSLAIISNFLLVRALFSFCFHFLFSISILCWIRSSYKIVSPKGNYPKFVENLLS